MSVPTAVLLSDRYGANNYHPLPVVLTRGQGVWVEDVEGRRYMDMLSSYSALNQGHVHPRIAEAAIAQMQRLTLTSRAFHNDRLGPFLEKLCRLSGFDRALPMNSGAEAVETALKAVRKWGYEVKGVPEGKAKIIACSDNFHGRTVTVVSFSTEEQYRRGFGPFTPGFQVVPYGDAQALEAAFDEHTVAFLVEPIQGEAGIRMPPPGYLCRARELCDRHHALLVLDEIQTGLGRTGRMFCFEHEGVRPDVVIIGKALAGGFYPVSAILADDEVMGVFHPGDHGSTFGGNPLGCAVARAALEVLVDERMVQNSAELGDYFLSRLREIEDPAIHEVRGRGLWIGLQLTRQAGGARRYCEALKRKGLLCKETHVDTIRFAPPLCIRREELDWAHERIRETFGEMPRG